MEGIKILRQNNKYSKKKEGREGERETETLLGNIVKIDIESKK